MKSRAEGESQFRPRAASSCSSTRLHTAARRRQGPNGAMDGHQPLKPRWRGGDAMASAPDADEYQKHVRKAKRRWRGGFQRSMSNRPFGSRTSISILRGLNSF